MFLTIYIPQLPLRPAVGPLLANHLPAAIGSMSTMFIVDKILDREITAQVTHLREVFSRLPREMLERTKEIILEENNYVVADSHIYMNSSKFLVQFDVENRVGKRRINNYNKPAPPKATFEDVKTWYMSLHCLTVSGVGENMRITCDCMSFQNSAWICSHVLAGFHVKGIIDVRRLTCTLDPVKRTGRPKKRKGPLQSIDMESSNLPPNLRPCHYVGQQIYVSGKLYIHAMAYLYTFYLPMIVFYMTLNLISRYKYQKVEDTAC